MGIFKYSIYGKDETKPLSVYGKTKLEGEKVIHQNFRKFILLLELLGYILNTQITL